VAPTAGGTLLVAVAIGYLALWFVARPVNEPTSRYLGELCVAALLTVVLARPRHAAAADRTRILRSRPRGQQAPACCDGGHPAARATPRVGDVAAGSVRPGPIGQLARLS